MPARSVRRREEDEDEDEDDEDEEDEKPRARKKPAKDDDDEDDEDDKPAKKPAAKDKKKDKDKAKKKDVPEEEEEEEEPRRIPKKGSKRYQMYVVRNGLAVLNGTLIALFAVGGYASLHLVCFQLLKFDTGTLSFISMILFSVLLGCVPFALLVAESMFFFTPVRADSRGSLIAAVTLQVIALLLVLVYFMTPTLVADASLAERLREFMLAGSNFAFWLGFLMLTSYIKQLYYYLGDKPGGNSASTLGLFFVIIVALGYGLFYAGWALLKQMEWLYMVLIPGWFLWDGAMSRCNVLILRNLRGIRDRVDNYIWPPEQKAL